MFGIGKHSKDIITLFHKASVPSSTRLATLLKTTHATAAETATEDQASDHTAQNKIQRVEFDLDITEAPPTSDQLSTILNYVGPKRVGEIVEGAKNESEALKTIKANADAFRRPVIVDWSRGHAMATSDEAEVVKMLNASPVEPDPPT